MTGVKKGVYLYAHTIKMLEKSGLLLAYSRSQLINWCMIEQIPIILKKKNIKNSEVYKLLELGRRKGERELILKARAEKSRKAYFFRNFMTRLKKMLDDNITKKHILEILDEYIRESTTYIENEEITKRLQEYKLGIASSKNLDLIREYLKIKIIEIDRLNKEVIIYPKVVENETGKDNKD